MQDSKIAEGILEPGSTTGLATSVCRTVSWKGKKSGHIIFIPISYRIISFEKPPSRLGSGQVGGSEGVGGEVGAAGGDVEGKPI